MNIQVNYLAVELAMISSMVVASVWYAKGVFNKEWAKLVNFDDKKIEASAGKAIAITVVISLITAYVLTRVEFLSNAFFKNSFLCKIVSRQRFGCGLDSLRLALLRTIHSNSALQN